MLCDSSAPLLSPLHEPQAARAAVLPISVSSQAAHAAPAASFGLCWSPEAGPHPR